MMDFLVLVVQLNVIVKVTFATKPQESVRSIDVSEDGRGTLAMKVSLLTLRLNKFKNKR